MSATRRRFGALITPDGVGLVEYAAERMGVRVIQEWSDTGRSASIGEALARLKVMLTSLGVRRITLSVAIEQFGALHHVMTLPPASDDVLRPIVRREVQRVFGTAEPVVAFARGAASQRPTPASSAASNQLFVAGAPRDTIDTIAAALRPRDIDVDILTVVPKTIQSLYQANGGALEPTAVLVCLEGGPHLSFFLDGRLELAIDPPIALEGEPPSVRMIVDQVERGAVYLRQQFRGATATRLLLAARPQEYDALAAALEQRLGVRVKPLFHGAASPEGVVAMGAVLEARQAEPLDLFPHAPRLAERVATLVRGPNAVVAAATLAAVVAGLWAAAQFTMLSSVQRDVARHRVSLQSEARAVEPMREVVQHRATFAQQVDFIRTSQDERSNLVATLQAIARDAPAGVRFDSLRVSRTPSAWSSAIEGQATGATAAQAVRMLDAFFQSVRNQPGISATNLEKFDYPAAGDAMHKSSNEVVIAFRLSLAIARPAAGAR